jgi:hypothetical protein
MVTSAVNSITSWSNTRKVIGFNSHRYYKLKTNMKQLTFIYELAKFMLISVPLACALFITAHLLFELKRLIR